MRIDPREEELRMEIEKHHQWIPSNGTEGYQFINDRRSCAATRATVKRHLTIATTASFCQILAASFRGAAKEWIEHDDGRTECTSAP